MSASRVTVHPTVAEITNRICKRSREMRADYLERMRSARCCWASATRSCRGCSSATRDELLAAEAASYHDAGTCTSYGTANTNQMLLEVMGLHLPGAAFVPPNTALRDALTIAATQRAAHLSAPAVSTATHGSGRELFGSLRARASDAESGARSCNP